ncbi:MAG: DUF2065 domain-containing protein [Burkholderiaceae bacterium]
MGESLLIAIGLLFVLEGLMPLIAPRLWRDTVQKLSQLQDGQIRFFGLIAVASGFGLVWLLS